jgi:alpha-mannosidase
VEASAAAIQAERLATPASATAADSLPGKARMGALEEIWKDILFNDFHDILPGSCTEPAEQDALDLYGRAMENIRRLNMESITAVNQTVEPLKAHIPVTVFNSNPVLSEFPVEFECMSDYRPFWEGEWVLKLFDRQGNEIPCQEEQPEARLPFHRWRRKISFLAQDLGFGTHHLYLTPSPPSFLRRGQGEVRGQGKVDPGMAFLVMNDTADSWGTNTLAWRDLAGRFMPDPVERIIGEGPVRTIYENVLSYHHSKIVVHRILYDGWPVTEYRIRIQWNEEQKRLKLSIPVRMDQPRLVAQIPGGSEIFPPDGGEYVHGTWMTLEPAGTSLGKIPAPRMNLAHNGMHGFDFDGKEVRLSILRSAAYCHEQGFDLNNGQTHKFMDMGIHEVRLAVWNDGPDPESVAEWLNAPPLVWPHLPIG